MKYLLDSCIVVWWFADQSVLSKKVREIIEDGKNSIFLSAASIWELSIKHRIGRLNLPHNFLDELNKQRIKVVDINAIHALATKDLPTIHEDPFDRMIIAQAKIEDFIVITADKLFKKYLETVLLN